MRTAGAPDQAKATPRTCSTHTASDGATNGRCRCSSVGLARSPLGIAILKRARTQATLLNIAAASATHPLISEIVTGFRPRQRSSGSPRPSESTPPRCAAHFLTTPKREHEFARLVRLMARAWLEAHAVKHLDGADSDGIGVPRPLRGPKPKGGADIATDGVVTRAPKQGCL